MIKVIYLILGEDLNLINDDDIIENLYKNVLPKINVNTLKDLFLNYIEENLDVDRKRIDELIKISTLHPEIYDQKVIIQKNRPLSYLCFALKDIYKYLTNIVDKKYTNGNEVYYEEIRNVIKKVEKLKLMVNNK